MHPTPRPRHPFKALVALLAMAALVHGVFAHAAPRHGHGSRIDIVTLHPACAGVDGDWDCDNDDDPDEPDAIEVDDDSDPL